MSTTEQQPAIWKGPYANSPHRVETRDSSIDLPVPPILCAPSPFASPELNAFKSFRIQLFRGKGLLSALIRWQTRSKWSHAAVRCPYGDMVLESYPGVGVRWRKLTPEDDDNSKQFIVVLPAHMDRNDVWCDVLAFIDGQVGRKYDYWSVIRFVSRGLLPGSKSAKKKWFCSELIFAAFESAGIKLLERVKADRVSPEHLSLSPLLVERV